MKNEKKVVSFIAFILIIISIGAIIKLYMNYTNSKIEIQAEENNTEVKIQELVEQYKNDPEVDKEYFDELVELCYSDESAIPILEHYKEYPPRIIKLVCVNNETVQFVINYLDKKGVKSENNIDISSDFQSGQVPLFIQWDERWGYEEYAGGLIGYTACGPTCLAMVYTYLTEDLTYNPKVMSEFSVNEGFVEEGKGTKWSFMTEGAQKLGLSSTEISIYEAVVEKNLSDGKVIICSMGPGDFTDNGHFIVMTNYENGQVTVNDPNSRKNSNKLWNYADICSQIKNIWAFWKN